MPTWPYPYTTRKSTLPPLLPLPPPPRGRGGGDKAYPLTPCCPLGLSERQVVADPVIEQLHLRLELRLLLIRHLFPPLLLLLLLLLPGQSLLEEELHRAGVHCLSSSVRQQRCGEERPRGSHVTDRDCSLRRGHLLKRLRPRPRPVRFLSPWGVVLLASRHLVETVVDGCGQGQEDGLLLMFSTMSAAAAPASASRQRPHRHQPPWRSTARLYTNGHQTKATRKPG